MSSEPAIRVHDVSKCYPVYERPADRLRQFVMPRLRSVFGGDARQYYREFWALRGISFEVQKGEQIGIVGRNGAGKSTLLQVICGTLAPTTGNVEVRGRVAALLELGAGFNPELTGRENIFLNGSVLGLERAALESRYEDIVRFADIPGFIEQPVKSYSSGMFMRLAFSVAVHVEPDVLVVDEALSVGDEAYQRKCHARIRDLRDRGTTILFVSHSAGQVTEVCDRALLIDRGEALCIGRAKDVVSHYQKLLYAPAGAEEDVRSAILAGGGDESFAVPGAPKVDEAWWDPGLVPQSTVVYPARGCRILDARVETPEGYRVNVLRPGDEYVYAYDVEFDAPAACVRFGMMIRSLTGIELAGGASQTEKEPIPFVASGSRAHVRFRFRNRLNHGTYFLNAGVVGLDREAETFLARHVDVAMFRVVRDASSRATGFMDVQPEGDVEWQA